TPARVFSAVPDATTGLLIWALGGVLAFVGALCFAELASTYPRSGGEYVYLTRAFGPWTGFLFAWAQLGVIRTGNIALLAFIFASFTDLLLGGVLGPGGTVGAAAAAFLFLTAINILGVTLGKNAQNVLTVLKVLGLAALVAAGVLLAQPAAPSRLAAAPPAAHRFGQAVIIGLFVYPRWAEGAFRAAGGKQGPPTLPRGL